MLFLNYVFTVFVIYYRACTIATTRTQYKVDYCISLLLYIPATQTNCLQLVLIYAALAVTKTPRIHHITHTIK